MGKILKMHPSAQNAQVILDPFLYFCMSIHLQAAMFINQTASQPIALQSHNIKNNHTCLGVSQWWYKNVTFPCSNQSCPSTELHESLSPRTIEKPLECEVNFWKMEFNNTIFIMPGSCQITHSLHAFYSFFQLNLH